MDKIAVISDIHGNLPALDAVLGDIRRRGIETIYCLGDLVGKGPDSAQAVDICQEVCECVVLGNWDDFMTNDGADEVIQWHQERLGPERLSYLKKLPPMVDLVMSGKRVRLYHASHISVYHRIHPYQPYEKLAGMFTNTEFTHPEGFEGAPEPDVVGYGDIHAAYMLPMYREKKTLFNAGSVGNPLDEPTAAYVILEGTLDSNKPAHFGLQIVRLQYDIDQAVADARAVEMPEIDLYERELRTAIYRGRPPKK